MWIQPKIRTRQEIEMKASNARINLKIRQQAFGVKNNVLASAELA